MPGWVAIHAAPAIILLVGVAKALNANDPMWLIFAAVLAMIVGYTARKFFGS